MSHGGVTGGARGYERLADCGNDLQAPWQQHDLTAAGVQTTKGQYKVFILPLRTTALLAEIIRGARSRSPRRTAISRKGVNSVRPPTNYTASYKLALLNVCVQLRTNRRQQWGGGTFLPYRTDDQVAPGLVAVNGTHRLPDALAPLINVRSGAEGDTQTPNVTK